MELLILKSWNLYSYICFILLLVGGIDLGLYGIFGINIIHTILGGFLGRLVCLAIGIAAGYLIYLLVLEKKKGSVA
jgi:uncharacterized membrane protein YuzA (DUF378 family)